MNTWFYRITRNKWLAVIWSAIIFFLMVMPKSRVPTQGLFGIPHLDKIVHMVLFGGFVWIWHQSFPQKPQLRSILIYFTLAACYGIFMEWVQVRFTDRVFDVWDIVADILGAGIMAALIARERKSPYGNRGRNQN
jgi:VanZ family protein